MPMLVLVLVGLVAGRTAGSSQPDPRTIHQSTAKPPAAAAATLRRFAEGELATEGDGRGSGAEPRLLLAVAGEVFDVTSGRPFYGDGGSYEAFAGRACGRGVALPSLEAADVSDDVSDFTPRQLKKLAYWVDFFRGKYPLVGTLEYDERWAVRRATDSPWAQALPLGVRRSPNHAARDAEREAWRRAAAAARREKRKAEAPPRAALRDFTPAELALHDGSAPGRPICLAVGGVVLDVSERPRLFAPGGPRAVYAGRAVTRALALRSTAIEVHKDPSLCCGFLK